MKLYTKTGDDGTTSLYNGSRVEKYSDYICCLGEIDELNSNLGLLKAWWAIEHDKTGVKYYNAPGAGAMFYRNQKCIESGKYYEWYDTPNTITNIQCILMDISSLLATPPPADKLDKWLERVGISTELVPDIEKLIDRLDSLVPKITNFVVPCGNVLVGQTHVCRSISRRVERAAVYLLSQNKNNLPEVIEQFEQVKKYLNRLSDFLFVLSRFFTMSLECQEDLYSRSKKLF